MAQQFEHSSDDNPLRAQRMTADESRAVIDLWQSERVEQMGLTDKPAVPDVAEGLDITVEDVQRLLQDVRAKRLEEERALATKQELSEVRLAEEERKLAEIRRQRAELRREQTAAEQGTASQADSVPSQIGISRKSNSVGTVISVIIFIVWLCFLWTMMAGNHSGGPLDNRSNETVCTTTPPGGKPEPCPPGFENFILHAKH